MTIPLAKRRAGTHAVGRRTVVAMIGSGDTVDPHAAEVDWVELAIYTHLPHSGSDGTLHTSRNHLNVLSADAIVALPGREGTESEVWLATQYGVPIVAYGDHQPSVPHGIAHAPTLDAVRAFLIQATSHV
jgi:hypothetical protein